MTPLHRFLQISEQKCGWRGLVMLTTAFALLVHARNLRAAPQEAANPKAPAVSKVEPPSWWVGLTPELMVLISGHNLEATHVSCNLPGLLVTRTLAPAGGKYLFVWLKFGAELRSGTAVCRITTPAETTSFELPLAARNTTIGRAQGLTQNDVLYLIVPDRFADGDATNDEPAKVSGEPGGHDRSKPLAYHGGDLRGAQEHLLYFKNLGVTALGLTFILKNGATEEYNGYGAVDLYGVDPHFGTLQECQELVAAAHAQHMKVFLTVAPSFVGAQHPWVENPPMPDWFHGMLQNHVDSGPPLTGAFYGEADKQENGNAWLEATVDPHTPQQMKRKLTEAWLFSKFPGLNTENPIVAQYLLQNAIWWTEACGVDGYRVEAIPNVSRKFWVEWNAGLRRIYPRLTTMGEVFDADPSVTSFFAGGQRRYDGLDSGLSMVFDAPMYFTLRDVLLHGRNVGHIAAVLRHDALYQHPEMLVGFFGNDEIPRFANAGGSSPAKLRLAFGLMLTLRGIPQLYYGDEIGMPGSSDTDSRGDFPGGWPGDQQNAFSEAGRTPEQQQIFATVQALLGLRRDHEALRSGSLWHVASDDTSYVFLRETDEEQILVAFNNSMQAREIQVSLRDTPAQGAVRISALFGEAKANFAGRGVRISLPSQSLSLFLLN